MGNERCHHGPVIESKDGVAVIDCSVCGFRHIDPLPDAEELEELYRHQFYQVEKQGYLDYNAEDLEWRVLELEERFKVAESLIGETGSKRVLDIGCGPGDFLVAGRKRGWRGIGIEPSPVAARFAGDRGLEVVEGFFNEDVLSRADSFEFLHLSQVLEHVPNPAETIRLAAEYLSRDGIMAVSVPNDYNPLQTAFCEDTGAPHWWVVPRHHLNYFTFDSLERLLRSQGLEPVARSTNFPMELFLLMGWDYTRDPSLGRELHKRRKGFDLAMCRHALDAQQAFYSALANAGLGRLAIVFARHSKS